MLEAGSTIDKYEILGTLGAGGMGIVYRARHVAMGHEVAIKVLVDNYAVKAKARWRFEQEAYVQGQLVHPNIVKVVEFLGDFASPAIVLELIEGPSLEAVIDERGEIPWSVAEAMSVMEPIVDAIAHAHERGIIHRDIKPGNVLLQEPGVASKLGVPKLTDFGLVKILSDTDQHTRTGSKLGTFPYMSPEQFEGSKDVGPKCDLHALAVMFWQLLAGRLPVHPSNMRDVMHFYGGELVPPSLESQNPGVSAELDGALGKGMARLPNERPESVEAWWKAVKAASTKKGTAKDTGRHHSSVPAGSHGEAIAKESAPKDKASPKPGPNLEEILEQLEPNPRAAKRSKPKGEPKRKSNRLTWLDKFRWRWRGRSSRFVRRWSFWRLIKALFFVSLGFALTMIILFELQASFLPQGWQDWYDQKKADIGIKPTVEAQQCQYRTLPGQTTKLWFRVNQTKPLTARCKGPQGNEYVDFFVEHGQLHGSYKKWTLKTDEFLGPNGQEVHKPGQKVLFESYEKGLLHGRQQSWHHNKQISSDCEYVAGKKHGTCVETRWDGSVERRIEWKNGVMHGDFSETMSQDDNSPRVKGSCANGLKHGVFEEWFEKVEVEGGKLKGGLKRSTHWNNGRRNGDSKVYGRRDGVPNSVLQELSRWRAGIQHGKQETYNRKGVLTSTENLKCGAKHGPRTRFSSRKGSVLQVAFYKDGKRSSKRRVPDWEDEIEKASCEDDIFDRPEPERCSED